MSRVVAGDNSQSSLAESSMNSRVTDAAWTMPEKRIKVVSDEDDMTSFVVTPTLSQTSSTSESPSKIPTNSNSCKCGHTMEDAPLSTDEIRTLLRKEANYDSSVHSNTAKRSQYLSWDDYFMAIAFLSAQRSKDPATPTGACIVDQENRVIGIGYNGFPRGCSDDALPWKDTSENWLHSPHPYMCHAEVNAILNKCSATVAGARMYVANFPCNECAKVIIQSRIQEVVYMNDPHPTEEKYRASRIMLTMAGVRMRRYEPAQKVVTLELASLFPIDDARMPPKDEITTTKMPTANDEMEKFRDLLRLEANWDPTVTKRMDYLSWDDYFMAVAFLTAKRSKDPNTQVGACIVDTNKCIVGLGYNGFPRGCSDDHLPWARVGGTSDLHQKYVYVCHAEVNAILNKGSADVKDATLYVAMFPCNECAKVIIQAGIREVVYLNDPYHDSDPCRASRIMFGMAGVKLRRLSPKVKVVTIQLDETE